MLSRATLRSLCACLLLLTHAPQGLSQRSSTRTTSTTTTTSPATSASASAPPSATSIPPPYSSSTSIAEPPDVLLNVPKLSVGRIELDVDNLKADINLNANVANLVSINAGVALSIQRVNLTIADVDAQLELVVRLGNLVAIVNRVFESLDLNPILISTINNVTSLLEPVVGAVDGLLGSITQGGTQLKFLVDNFGNIVQQVTGANGNPVSTIVGDYLTNMTYTGASQTLQNGLVQKTYSYSPLNALVDILFNSAGQVVQATVAKQGAGSTGTSSSTAAQPSGSTGAMR